MLCDNLCEPTQLLCDNLCEPTQLLCIFMLLLSRLFDIASSKPLFYQNTKAMPLLYQ